MTINPQQPASSLTATTASQGRQTAGQAGAAPPSTEPFARTLRRALDSAQATPFSDSSASVPPGSKTAAPSGQSAQNSGSLGVSSAVLLDLLETLVTSEMSTWNTSSNTLGPSGAAGSIMGSPSPLSAFMAPGSPLPSLVSSGSSPATPLDSSASAAVTAQTPGAAATVGPTDLRSALQPLIASLAPQYGLSSQLVNALISQESSYNPAATSSAGAMGLMQLMPATAASLGVTDPYDPVANLRGGMQYLSGLLKQYNGNLPLALAAYNAGPGAVNEYGGIPPYPQTQQYVARIMSQVSDSIP